MISLPFRRPTRSPNIDALYGMIVAQARSPRFYGNYGVPDTVAGRLDMIVLHLVLVLRQLAAGQGALPPLGQELFDHFCRDIDDNLREMGVGDLTVPKQMQRVAETYYGRAKAYEQALTGGGPELDAAVGRNVFGAAAPPLGAQRLAAYMRLVAVELSRMAPEALERGDFRFPDPDTVGPPRLPQDC